MNALQTPTATHRTPGVLHMVCGKIGSGKSTLARQLAQALGQVEVPVPQA